LILPAALEKKKTNLFSSPQIQNLPPTATFTPMSNAAKAGDFERGVFERRFLP